MYRYLAATVAKVKHASECKSVKTTVQIQKYEVHCNFMPSFLRILNYHGQVRHGERKASNSTIISFNHDKFSTRIFSKISKLSLVLQNSAMQMDHGYLIT